MESYHDEILKNSKISSARCSPSSSQPLLSLEVDNEENERLISGITKRSYGKGIFLDTQKNEIYERESDGWLPISPYPRNEYLKGIGLLGVSTFFFGSYSPLIRTMFTSITDHPPLMIWNACVAIIGLCVAELHRFTFPQKYKPLTEDEVHYGLELGFWSFMASSTNTIGISLTTADQAAFCVETTTIMVPLIQGFCGVPVPGKVWLGCVLSILGIWALIASSSESASSDQGFKMKTALVGDLLCILAAFSYSMFDVRVHKFGKKSELYNLAYTKMVAYAGFSVLGAFLPFILDWTGYYLEVVEFWNSLTPDAFKLISGVMIWNGALVQFLAHLIMIHGQDIVGPSRAQVIYALTPFLSAIIAWCILGETLGSLGLLGMAIFMVALLIVIQNPPEPDL